MAFSCGCPFIAGEAVSIETLRAHYKHTLEAVLFWELLFRKQGNPVDKQLMLSQARLDLFEAIEELFPEAISSR